MTRERLDLGEVLGIRVIRPRRDEPIAQETAHTPPPDARQEDENADDQE